MTSTSIPITVTAVGSLISQAVIKSLHHPSSGQTFKIQGLDYFTNAFGFRWCDSRAILPDLLAPEVSRDVWFDNLCEKIKSHGSRYVFLGADFELSPIAERRHILETYTGSQVIVSRPELVRTCRDKLATAELLKSLGFTVPISIQPSTSFKTMAQSLGLPFLMKPRWGSRGRGQYLIYSENEFEYALLNCEKPMVQQYLPSAESEYSCGISNHADKVDSVCVMRRRLRDGNTEFAESDYDPKVTAYCRAIAEALDPTGPLNIQLRLHQGEPKAFEINPRFSGTTYFRTLLGVNEPARLIAFYEGNSAPSSAILRPGAVRRFFDESIEEPLK